VTVKSTDSPYNGFKTLIDNHILSAPVFDVVAKKYTGFLDMRDLVSFVIFVDDDQSSEVPNNLQDIVLHGAKLFKVPVDGVTCTYLSRRNPFHPVSTTDSLLVAVEILAKGIHRVPVVDQKSGEVVNIISQSSVIQFLHKHHQEFKQETSGSISELKLGTVPVISVNKNTLAIDTFRLMDKRKISGVAVVDDDGKLVGNTSSSDIKVFMKHMSLSMLREPTTTFLNRIRQENVENEMSPTISCNSHDSLATAIGKLASTQIHKLFVADDANGYKPACVLSITDILRYIVK